MSQTPSSTSQRERLVAAIHALNTECVGAGLLLEICVWDGIEMLLAFDATTGSRDLGGVFRPATELAEAARSVAMRNNLPADWLERGVTKTLLDHGSASGEAGFVPWKDLSHVRLVRPTPEYLLAMKCLAARAHAAPRDRTDAALLVQRLGLRTSDAVLALVGRYAPRDRLHVRTREFVADILRDAHGGPTAII